MAIKKDFEMPFGVTVQGALCRVDGVSLNRDQDLLFINIGIYKDDYQSKVYELEMVDPITNTSSDLVSHAYSFMKTQPEFEGGEDV